MLKDTDSVAARPRMAHAVLDESSRILKARKIIDLLGEQRFSEARSILEIGCGSGVISSTLAKLGRHGLKVVAVDVADNRLVKEGYEFFEVNGTTLPFESDSFDIVITNHVIEHVGDHADQLHHLQELSRVMKANGCAYLAVPNKWRVIEPHYRLPFLSWIPIKLADLYLRSTSRGNHYDCVPLSRSQASDLFKEAGLEFQELTIEAVYSTLKIEFSGTGTGRMMTRAVPRALIVLAKPLISTLIFKLERPAP